MTGILAVVGFFGTIFGILYIYYSTRNRERLALIEKGTDASIFNKGVQSTGYPALKIGMLFAGAGIGILAGYFLSKAGMLEVAAYFSMILFFGGLGLVTYYLIEKKIMK
ncbi:MAG: hypothetical protein IIA88_01595 [Bacteroidetes bacterium]|nr:hypothetical protein [Bacteroidota bacterium]